MESVRISTIEASRDEAKLTLLGVPDQPGVASRILDPIAEAGIDIDIIVQNVGADGCTDFTFTVQQSDYPKALELVKQQAEALGARELNCEDSIASIALIGVGMRSHAGIASQMFSVLAEAGINIRMISTSEIKIAVVVDEKYLQQGVDALKRAFNVPLDA